jgi:hypothetical protein
VVGATTCRGCLPSLIIFPSLLCWLVRTNPRPIGKEITCRRSRPYLKSCLEFLVLHDAMFLKNQLSIVRLRVRPEGPLSELSNLSGGNTHFTMLELVIFVIHMSILIMGFCNQRFLCIANWHHWFAMCPRY